MEKYDLDLIHYNIAITISIIISGTFILLGIMNENYSNWFIAGVAITISVVLFLISLKFDKISTRRLFALLDDNKRKILETLTEKKTLDELITLYEGRLSHTVIGESIKSLKKAGLVRERKEFETEDGKGKKVKKFSRSF